MNIIDDFLSEIIELISDRYEYIKDNVIRPYLTIYLPSDHAKARWQYFLRRFRETGSSIDSYFEDGCLKIVFPQLTEENNETLTNFLNTFIRILKKKYHTVAPKVSRFVMIVKTTHRCNLNCKHCYDAENRALIKDDLSFEYIDKCLQLLSEYTERITWIWHGGEPTMVGTQFFYEVYEKVFSKYPMLEIKSSLMSNGYKINHEWVKMFKDLNIEVGISYDGMAQSDHRLESCGSEYALPEQYLMPNDELDIKRVNLEHTLKYMKDAGLRPGIITVISNANYDKQIYLYEMYKKMGINFSFNLIYPVGNAVKNKHLELDIDKYMEHFTQYFTHWFYDINGVKERSCFEALKLVTGGGGETCINSDCRKNFVGLNPLGIISPCDRKLPPEYDCGSIMNYNSFDEVFNSVPYRRYYEEAQIRFETKCSNCGLFETCKGGCNSNAINIKGSGVFQEDFYCKLTRYRFMFVYHFLRDFDISADRINPHVREFLLNSRFYSVSEIKQHIDLDRIEVQYGIKFEYNQDDILNCTEFQVFKGINWINTCSKCKTVPVDFVKSYSQTNIERNRVSRAETLKSLLRSVAQNACGIK